MDYQVLFPVNVMVVQHLKSTAFKQLYVLFFYWMLDSDILVLSKSVEMEEIIACDSVTDTAGHNVALIPLTV